MATNDKGIFERPAGSGIWWILWYDQQGKRHREKAGTKSTARALYAKRKAGVLEGRKLPELTRRRELTLAEVIERYRERFEAKRSCREDVRYAGYWKSALGTLTLAEVNPTDVERWRARRMKDDRVAPATVNRAVAFLKWTFNLAIRDGIFSGPNPVARVSQLRENNSVVRYLSAEEESALAKAAKAALWLKIRFAFLTGLRQTEQFSLRRDDLDFTASVITIRRSKHGEKRHVPITPEVRALLQEVLDSHDSEWVWPGRIAGRPFTGTGAFHALQTACKAAGVKDFRWHDLRHTFCSRLAMAGVSLVTIQKLAGHKTIKVTERYAHLSPEHQREAMGKLSRKEHEEALLPMDPDLLAKALRGRLPVDQLEALVEALTATATKTATSPKPRAPIPMFSGN